MFMQSLISLLEAVERSNENSKGYSMQSLVYSISAISGDQILQFEMSKSLQLPNEKKRIRGYNIYHYLYCGYTG